MDATLLCTRLSGGDRRSIGCSDEIVTEVLGDRSGFAHLIEAMTGADPLCAMRAADAAEKVSRREPGWLAPHRDILIALMLTSRQKEVQWHLAMMMPRLPLDAASRGVVETMLVRWLESDSRIVRVEAVNALAGLAGQEPAGTARIRRLLDVLAGDSSPAMRARVRKLVSMLGARGTT